MYIVLVPLEGFQSTDGSVALEQAEQCVFYKQVRRLGDSVVVEQGPQAEVHFARVDGELEHDDCEQAVV